MPYFWLLDCIMEKEITVQFVRSVEMLADALTKPLPLPAFRGHVNTLMRDVPQATHDLEEEAGKSTREVEEC